MRALDDQFWPEPVGSSGAGRWLVEIQRFPEFSGRLKDERMSAGKALTALLLTLSFSAALLKLIEALQKPEHRQTWVYRCAEALWLFVERTTSQSVLGAGAKIVAKTLTKGPSRIVKIARKAHRRALFSIYAGLSRSALTGREPTRAAAIRDDLFPWLCNVCALSLFLRVTIGLSWHSCFRYGLLVGFAFGMFTMIGGPLRLISSLLALANFAVTPITLAVVMSAEDDPLVWKAVVVILSLVPCSFLVLHRINLILGSFQDISNVDFHMQTEWFLRKRHHRLVVYVAYSYLLTSLCLLSYHGPQKISTIAVYLLYGMSAAVDLSALRISAGALKVVRAFAKAAWIRSAVAATFILLLAMSLLGIMKILIVPVPVAGVLHLTQATEAVRALWAEVLQGGDFREHEPYLTYALLASVVQIPVVALAVVTATLWALIPICRLLRVVSSQVWVLAQPVPLIANLLGFAAACVAVVKYFGNWQ